LKYDSTQSININSINWNNDLLKSTYSTCFQAAEFLTSDLEDITPVFIYIVNENDEIVGQLGLRIIDTTVMYSSPLFKRYSKIISNITKRITWVHGPIIHSKNIEERKNILTKILKEVDEVAKKYDVVYIEGHTSPSDFLIDENYQKIFRNNGYVKFDFRTFLADLSGTMEELWSNVSKKARGDVNRAKRREIQAKVLKTNAEIDDFVNLNMEWAKTKGLTITNPEKQKEIFWKNHKSGIEKFFLAYKEKKLISGLRVGCFNNIAYTNFVINSYDDSTNLGGTLLTWYALEWAKNNNFRMYDFSGANKYTSRKSMLAYKEKWGGKETPYYVFRKIRKNFSYKLYSFVFNLLQKYYLRRSKK
jgi:hypothetical protein